MCYVRSTEKTIPLPSNYVDVLFTLNAIDHVARFEVMCKEILRILAPGGDFFASFNLDDSGIYTVLAGDLNSDNTGSFNIYIERTNNPRAAVPFPLGKAVAGTLSLAAEMDSYTFSGRQDGWISVNLWPTSG